MPLAWLESLKKLPRLPARLERKIVRTTRESIKRKAQTSECAHPTLWVDISVISRHDAGSGIQRVVRALLAELQLAPPAGWRVQLVAATPKQAYRAVPWQIPTVDLKKWPKIEPQNGDVFLGLDLSAHIIPKHQDEMANWKSRGVKIAFVVYDLLPLEYPEWFSAKLVRAFRRWTKSVAILADSVFCISATVQDDFERIMFDRYGLARGEIVSHVFPMGGDIAASQPSRGFPECFSEIIRSMEKGRAVLLVGTIEPRKGHALVLEAFERLWAGGGDFILIIAGRPGWMTDKLQQEINSSPELGKRLYWLNSASDEALQTLYRKCQGVVVASYAEGYGLPLLEAIDHGKPVLVRDIPVFRQFQTSMVSYFPADASAAILAEYIEEWLSERSLQALPQGRQSGFELPTWRASLSALLAQLLPVANSHPASRSTV